MTGGRHIMRLKQIVLSGFKSFADRTEIAFDNPIIGLVGPNGCGKSNVVDAVRWVLGERSAKSLRGEAMMDVIFAGSAKRKAMGAASVTLIFEKTSNTEYKFKDGSTEIEITRRLYRDGRSEYLINGQKVRLRDLKDLFLDSGIGTSAYSIIEQGRVAALLQANPVERRGIIEEAAGVSKFRLRRTEAQKKLERADFDLTRLRDKIESTKRRLARLERQAEKARKYKNLDKESKALRESVAIFQYKELTNQLMGLTSQLQRAQNLFSESQKIVEETENNYQEKIIEKERLSRIERELSEKYASSLSSIKYGEKQYVVIGENLQEARQEQNDQRKEIELLKNAIEENKASILTLDEDESTLTHELDTLQKEKKSHTYAISELEERRFDTDKKSQEISRLYLASTTLMQDLSSSIRSLNDRLENANNNIYHLKKQQIDSTKKRDAQFKYSKEIEDKLQKLEIELENLTNKLKEAESAASLANEDSRASIEELSLLREQRRNLESRIHLLEEMELNGEGLDKIVQKTVKKFENRDGFIGSLNSQINVTRKDALAIETALGPMMQTVIVEKESVANEIQKFVKENSGRLGIIKTQQIDIYTDPNVNTPFGSPIINHFKCDTRIESTINKILSKTLLVDSLPEAHLNTLDGWRFVTRSGDLLENNGTRWIKGKMTLENGGLLSRRAEQQENRQKLSTLLSKLRLVETKAEEKTEHAKKLLSTHEELGSKALSVKHQCVDLEFQCRSEKETLERYKQESNTLESDFNKMNKYILKLQIEHESLIKEHDIAETNVNDLKIKSEEAITKMQSISNNREIKKGLLADVRESLATFESNLSTIRTKRRELNQEKSDLESRRIKLGDLLARRASRVEQLEAEYANLKASQELQKKEIESILKQKTSADLMLQNINQILASASSNLEQARSNATNLQRDAHALEVSRREVEVKREHAEDRATDDLELNLNQIPLNDTFEDRLDTDEALSRLEVLDRELKNLGNVNLDSIEEEEEVVSQSETLSEQLADVESAQLSLSSLIDELEHESRSRLEITFAAIREHFAGGNGLFRQLFGGGSADIMLIPDENSGETDILESGIEIKAKPPGKEPRIISQLSGGEKAMTAVALLLSIFKAKPSPFCILDEVDAALDEANLDRFSKTLTYFLDKSHFIVITHRKRTMVGCDAIYGITMQERGVSTRVAVEADQINEKGEVLNSAISN